jgi:hypothetical protein
VIDVRGGCFFSKAGFTQVTSNGLSRFASAELTARQTIPLHEMRAKLGSIAQKGGAWGELTAVRRTPSGSAHAVNETVDFGGQFLGLSGERFRRAKHLTCSRSGFGGGLFYADNAARGILGALCRLLDAA